MKRLRQITVVGLGLLGGSVALAVLRTMPGVRIVGYSHRPVTRRKARQLGVADVVVDSLTEGVERADIVILATPILTFENIFKEICGALPSGCIVTDVGSTKVQAHRWAERILPKSVYYVGSHPIAGSEQRGVEFARDDLFEGTTCILTATKRTSSEAVRRVKEFWGKLGCSIRLMDPSVHDRILADVSHLPHTMAAALVNASDTEEMKLAGQGFIDASRIASGPANIWADILLTNSGNTRRAIGRVVKELEKLQKAISNGDERKIRELLDKARKKRSELIKYKMRHREIS
ncbi:MAG: prephenate dehydrogenase [Planctomycetota bacterium]